MGTNKENEGAAAGAPRASRLRAIGAGLFCAAVLAVSFAPAALTFQSEVPDVGKVQEMRTLAVRPKHWEGGPLAVDVNFTAFNRWFNDNVAYRSWMIRVKNELDHALFRSSSRVYFGTNGEIYGRQLLDKQLPTAELLFRDAAATDRIAANIVRLSDDLRKQGATLLLLTPMQRQNFSEEGLPFTAPHMKSPSYFMSNLYPRLKASAGENFIDVYDIMQHLPAGQPKFFKQDFHWSDFSAWNTAKAITMRIAVLEGRPFEWRYPLEVYVKPEVGADARFAALATETPVEELRVDNRKWPPVHRIIYQDPDTSGLEYVTDEVNDPSLLPTTCLYGNSFSDGMVSIGLLNHFRAMTRLSRGAPIEDIPALTKGRCKYVIVQLLDISPFWASLNR